MDKLDAEHEAIARCSYATTALGSIQGNPERQIHFVHSQALRSGELKTVAPMVSISVEFIAH